MYNKLIVFQDKQIRRTLHKGEWWFSVIDIVEMLTRNERPRKYWSDLKKSCCLKVTSGCPKKSDN